MATLRRMEDGKKDGRMLQKWASAALEVMAAVLDRQRVARRGRNVYEIERGVMRYRYLLQWRVSGARLMQPSVPSIRPPDGLLPFAFRVFPRSLRYLPGQTVPRFMYQGKFIACHLLA